MGDADETNRERPQVADHTLLRCVGEGGFGQVWLAQSVIGTFRAIKIVYRNKFDTERPFEREFNGLCRYETVSRGHPGLVDILQIGRNDAAGYFYSVMEIADDLNRQDIDPQSYDPKTLARYLGRRGALPVRECFELAITLTDGLGHLHAQNLVHRDVKPSNIIFVDGVAKFADVGLVTKIGDKTTGPGGTVGYIPPEGPGSPAADIFSLGKVIYEMGMGKHCHNFPELPTELGTVTDTPALLRLNEVILKACDDNCNRRYRSAAEIRAALVDAARRAKVDLNPQIVAGPQAQPVVPDQAAGKRSSKQLLRVSILYRPNVEPDDRVLRLLRRRLTAHGYDVFVDDHTAVGMEWARGIEQSICSSDAVIVLLSPYSVQSEMLAYEVEAAHQAGKPRLVPARLALRDPLPSALSRILAPLPQISWEDRRDDEHLVSEVLKVLKNTPAIAISHPALALESIGGAVPLSSEFYVVRPTDRQFQAAIERCDSVVLVKGARQMGKTSLLARGLQHARDSGARVALTDFQKLNTGHLASLDSFFLTLASFLADQVEASVPAEDAWDKRRGANTNFERYLRREILGKISTHFVWGLDEVDRLFTCSFGSEVFGLFRSWHNERALDPSGPWSRLTLAIAYATEAHLFISDINQSPFNVGTRLTLEDFTLEQVAELNRRYRSPISSAEDLRVLFDLLGGQPYLIRRGLNELVSGDLRFADLAAQADRDEGLFGDHLRRILVLLAKDLGLRDIVRGILRGKPCPDPTSFYRLRTAGVVAGESPADVRLRCRIYETYLRRHLL